MSETVKIIILNLLPVSLLQRTLKTFDKCHGHKVSLVFITIWFRIWYIFHYVYAVFLTSIFSSKRTLALWKFPKENVLNARKMVHFERCSRLGIANKWNTAMISALWSGKKDQLTSVRAAKFNSMTESRAWFSWNLNRVRTVLFHSTMLITSGHLSANPLWFCVLVWKDLPRPRLSKRWLV